MTPSLALSLALSSLVASPRAHASPPAVTHARTDAWAVVHAGQLWICWARGPDCWRRVDLDEGDAHRIHELDEADDAGPDFVEALGSSPRTSQGWRLGFSGPRTLWIEVDGRRWRVDRGQRSAEATTAPAPIPLARPRVHACAARGSAPAWIGGRLGFRDAPGCRPAQDESGSEADLGGPRGCVPSTSPIARATRRPTPVRLRAGIQLTTAHAWTARDDLARGLAVARVQPRAGVEVLFFVELGLDLAAARRDERARASLIHVPGPRTLPPVPPGPLAARERAELAAVICGEAAR